MLLQLYIETTVISWAYTLYFLNKVKRKLKKEGYLFTGKKESDKKKNIKAYLDLTSLLFIPVVNIATATALFTDRKDFYEKIKLNLERDGKIIKKKRSNNVFNNHEESNDKEKSNSKNMTNQEKIAYLQEEKKRILGIKSSGNTKKMVLTRQKRR